MRGSQVLVTLQHVEENRVVPPVQDTSRGMTYARNATLTLPQPGAPTSDSRHKGSLRKVGRDLRERLMGIICHCQ